jgi:hypothetical protein
MLSFTGLAVEEQSAACRLPEANLKNAGPSSIACMRLYDYIIYLYARI